MRGIKSDLPSVTLTKSFTSPYDNAVATARTCYARKIIYDHDVARDERSRALRDKIAKSTYVAGHHTTLQHAHFQFAVKNISRHVLWGFFHAHPFYNSEQVSQRYVPVKDGTYLIPDFPSNALRERYLGAIERQKSAYETLNTYLHPVCEELYFEIYRGRRKNKEDKRWQSAIRKRCQEIARYVLPLATHAHLYHTISGLSLHRYHKLAESLDCPQEQKLVVDAMVNEVTKVDPNFFRDIEDKIPLETTLEARLFQQLSLMDIDSRQALSFKESFDAQLNGRTAAILSHTPSPEKILGTALRNILCLSPGQMSDEDAVSALMSPARNGYLGESLNLASLSKAMRALDMVHFTFNKKMSHSADSQAQRHRMIPGARPIFSRTIDLLQPDYITPEVFFNDQAKKARALYIEVMEKTFDDMCYLHKNGASAESLQYLITNAHPIRYTDSASLMDHHHKWTTRLCYNAQEEIWRSTLDEVKAVKKVAPLIGNHLLPPCSLRHLSAHSPVCPEGDRFCGVPVWKQTTETYRRLL